MRGLFKTYLAIVILLWHLLETAIGRLLIRDPVRLRAFYLRKVSAHARWYVKWLGVNLIVDGIEHARSGQNYLIVGNHLSYLDAVVMAAFRPTSFVTSIEMREVPVLGLITELGGCLYVERRNRENIHNEISGISDALEQGFNVVVFPEATSTDGSKVLPFKRPLFAAAAKAARPVLPVVIQYEKVGDEPVTRMNRDILCWYGDMRFGGHFLRLTRQKSVTIRLKVLPEIPVTPDSNRDNLMEEAHARITAHYRPIS